MIRLLLVLLIFLLSSCGTSDEHAGGTWDEAGNTVSITVKDKNGNALKDARVRVVSLAEWESNFSAGSNLVNDSALTDSAGVAMMQVDTFPVRLEVQKETLAGEHLFDGVQIEAELEIRSAGRIEGTIKDANVSSARKIALAGTSYLTEINDDGTFAFESVPEGGWTISFVEEEQVHYSISALVIEDSVAKIDSIQLKEEDFIVLDDFSDDIPAAKYYYSTGASWWFCSSDSFSTIITENIMSAHEFATDKPELGRVIHFEFDIEETAPGKFATCGLDIGNSRTVDAYRAKYDLSGMDSITFEAKGAGELYFQLVSLTGNGKNEAEFLTVVVELDSAWTTHSITKENLISLYGEEDVSNSLVTITSIIFNQNQDVEFWLDNIILHGMKPSELF